MTETLILYEEHQYVLDRLDNLSGCLFLTGKAGTGKSTLLQLFQKLSSRNILLLAPTGVAAVNIKGQTIHSFFKFPPHWIQSRDYKIIPKKNIEKIDLIIIDEISMVRADLLDHIDKLLKLSAQNFFPFGGKAMLWTGDLFQLPPVLRGREEKDYFSKIYRSPYFFSSRVFQELPEFEFVELAKVFRQKDRHFIKLLEKIRLNELDWEELEEINSRYQQSPNIYDDDFTITLTSTNQAAQMINKLKLAELPGDEKIYKAEILGSMSPSQYPADELLGLKEGAQIMMLRNDPAKRFVNGSLGIVLKLNDDSIDVRIEKSDHSIQLERFNWEIIRYTFSESPNPELQTEVVGNFNQFPIRLAWAITIHKSQGKTFDKAIIDFGRGAFEAGQAYVALSRCKSLDGIQLKQKIQWGDIQTDARVIEFIQRYR